MKEETTPIRGRLAPSPTGGIHLGNIWSALVAWLGARSAGGEIFLRLEDLDPQRCTREYCNQVMEDFRWLGLDWDNTPIYQSERTHLYEAAFQRLQEQGLIYPCYCTRAQRAASAPHASDGEGVYAGTCGGTDPEQLRLRAGGRVPAWRVRVPDETIEIQDELQGAYSQELRDQCGDFILRRSDGVYAYQLAVVVDDGDMGITQVVRGRDLLSSAPRQRWLQRILGLRETTYAHVPLLVAGDGRRLAKRDQDQELSALQRTYTAPELIGKLAFMGGIIDKDVPITPRQLIAEFCWETVCKDDIIIRTF